MTSFLRSGAALLAVLFLVLPGVARADEDLVKVPAVAERPLAEARTALLGAGFVVATMEVAGEPEGSVATQNPAADAVVPRGSIVLLEVRQKTETTQAPRAVGLSVSEAMAAFGSLYVLELTPASGKEADRGKIVDQSPAMGGTLPLRSAFRLKFVPQGKPDDRVPVPDISGLTAEQGVQALGEAGLHARIARVAAEGAPADLTIGQTPLPGTEVTRFSSVVLVVTEPSSGEPPGTPNVDVPNVQGMSESSAREELHRLGLVATVEWVSGDPSQAFLVAAQDPAAGTGVGAGTEVKLQIVRLVVPTQPTPSSRVPVPALVGMTQMQADDVLTSLGLVGAPVLAPNPNVPPLRVFAQDLPAGRWVDPGTQIGYRIATPPPPPQPVPVPDFYGRTKGNAIALAAQAGLLLDVIDLVTNSYAPHRVFSQNVPAWSWRPLGSTVTVKIARPPPSPPTSLVPNLFGKTPNQAQILLAQAGLVGLRSDVMTMAHPALRVFAQNPAQGSSVLVGSVVQFTVAKPALNLRLVPNLNNLTKLAAIQAVQAAGLVPDPEDVFAPGKPLGRAFWQDPPGGVWRNVGSIVRFKVSAPLLAVIPNVVGMPTITAKNTLQAAGFNSTLVIAPKIGVLPGRVWDQNPNGGASAGPGTNVTLRATPGGGGGFAIVPNVVGQLTASAVAQITAMGFLVDVVEQLAPGQPLGRVFAQSPIGGSSKPAGTVVVLKIPQTGIGALVQVPNLIGLTPNQAQNALALKGLLSDGKLDISFGKPHGRVYSQNRPAGALVAPGTTVKWRWNP